MEQRVTVAPEREDKRVQPLQARQEECHARANLYRLLAGAFAEEPTHDYLQALRSPESLAALTEAGLSFDTDFTDTPLTPLQDELACEYATLLASPGGCPPVESARLTGRYQQEPYFAVQKTYRRAGFALQKARFAVFEDSLGVELLFAARLLDRAETALIHGDMAAYRRIDKEIRRFWALHLGRWVRGYANLVERAAQHSFYREMSKLLRGFAENELAALKLHVEDVDGGKEIVPKSELAVLVNVDEPDEPVCNGCQFGNAIQRDPLSGISQHPEGL